MGLGFMGPQNICLLEDFLIWRIDYPGKIYCRTPEIVAWITGAAASHEKKQVHRVSHETFFFTAATHETISPGALPAVKPAHLTHEFGDKK